MKNLNCICGSDSFSLIHILRSSPEREVKFAFSSEQEYYREIHKCNICAHYISVHSMDTSELYNEEYVNSTYKGEKGIRAIFDKIISLPKEKSDNQGRVKRVIDFGNAWFSHYSVLSDVPSILDVGSGLSVFLYLIKQSSNWNCTALDPDQRQVEHAKKKAKVNAICNDFMKVNDLKKFDIISFNKVLEHVEDPVAMLKHSVNFLQKNGFVYIELPDAETAIQESPETEEFFIDHFHIFSAASLAILCEKAGFLIKKMERLKEPSGKYTLWAFISLK